MLRDVFYYGTKPNAHPREKLASSLDDARLQATTEHFWIINEHCDYTVFDWDWDFDFLPDEDVWAQDHNNVWPSYHKPDSGTWLCAKEHSDVIVYRADVEPLRHKSEWQFSSLIDLTKFDLSWHPDPALPPFIYQFGTQWAKTHGPCFHVPGATEIKYMDYPVAVAMADMTKWEIPKNVDVKGFDFSWHPDGTSPPYIYQFGTLLDETDGPRYITPGNDGTVVYVERKEIILEELEFPKYYIKTVLEDLINEHSDEIFWALNPDLDYSNFDFKWIPDRQNVYHVNAFGSKDSINSQTYFVNGRMWQKGYRDINYVEDKTIDIRTKIDMFFIDKGNPESQERYAYLCEKYGNVVKTRYLNSWVDTINRCITRSETKLSWILNSELDYSDFEFDFYPSPWQMNMVHVFGTQWSHWGTTFMVNKESFPIDTKYVKVIEHLSNLNFVKSKRAKATNVLYDIVYINHGNVDTSTLAKYDKLVVDYDTSYLNTFKKVLEKLPSRKEHYVWMISTICDYSTFDFTYICDPYTREHLHVFPSDKQKFGDTFLVDVNKLRSLISDVYTLEDYDKVNFNQHQRVSRLTPPVIYSNDTHTTSMNVDFKFPYAVFITDDNKNLNDKDIEPMSLWDEKSKSIMVTSTGASRIVVPKEAKKFIKTELYDYPYITTNKSLLKSNPLDIIFISNSETIADQNYEHLLRITKNLPNKVIRIDSVQGRVASQHAAANASDTPWYFLINAKLKVNDTFNFDWQPDRLQIPKHYIFLATNPVNGLEYGHMATVANNKQLTLNTVANGLDFTMDSEHEVVNVNSGIAHYNSSEWDTWRTSFREVIKLQNDQTHENRKRLDAWLTNGIGDFAQYSIDGARDAVQYYQEVNGDFDKLKLSYDWPWLKSYFDKKYK